MKNTDKIYAERIAEEYAPKKEREALQLKRLDGKVKRPAKIFAYCFGSIGALVTGAGMSMVLTDFGLQGKDGLAIGVALGVLGLILCGINHPIYAKILKERKRKYAFEVVELAKEISEEE